MRSRGVLVPALLVVAAGCSTTPTDVPRLPPPAEVGTVVVTVFGTASSQPDLAEFEVPPAFVPDVLRIVSPAEYHEHTPAQAADVVACLRITDREYRAYDVNLINTSGDTVHFTIQGVPCRRVGTYADLEPQSGAYLPEVMRIESFLRAIHKGKTNKARALLDRLDKSAGR